MVRRRVAVRLRVRSRSKLFWAGWTVAPWCLAAGLLVSFVADAGQDPTIGATRMVLNSAVPGLPAVLVPGSLAGDAVPRDLVLPRSDAVVQEARLIVGDQADIETAPDELDPKAVVKAGSHEYPAVDRSKKGDPAIGLRPTFDVKLRRRGSLPGYLQSTIAFGESDFGAPPNELLPPTADVPGPDSVSRFEPIPGGLALTTRQSFAAASPAGAGAGTTTSPNEDGATPVVARAVALASATPVEAGSTPVQIAPLPKFSRGPNGEVATGTTMVMGIVDQAPAFAGLIDQANSASELRCLAEAVYFEARSEPEEGQAAVAQVVLNRVMSGLYPTTICGVVFQNQQRRNACQFSFACEGHALHVNESDAWTQAARVAREVLDGATYVSDVGVATHYHANYVQPGWARRLVKMDKIGRHIFYKLKPGQT
ncbi:cell wall hydrolase [Lichenifustis flavocetrariae]|uniref:Cell wall hydrolase n=1 Tax=Lichenifustis flavocetrariae TaxID=2949735 RepID=A0AA41YQU4_9HYPH|nr:cell wall hydrolase [Lichenifustis flavocetrariae]MCW6506459.1 cell wall hydrolase [Lichenifustis flavocetrariae]